jgi:hypothetical protein
MDEKPVPPEHLPACETSTNNSTVIVLSIACNQIKYGGFLAVFMTRLFGRKM